MNGQKKLPFLARIKNIFIGEAKNPLDKSVFHNISLIAFFAWVGLGADGLSSSCYGPPEAFMALGSHYYLGILIALATSITIYIIAESYSQVIETFPGGGGGYLVASTLLSPRVGMISGCALLIDYILTITLSVAAGADALFSFFPASWLAYKLGFALAILVLLIFLNLRGVKESIMILMPIFMAFVVTHIFIIGYALLTHLFNLPVVVSQTAVDVRSAVSEVGYFGLFFMLMKAYSLGAGTYTGIEAVSNGLPVLREPKVETAKQTMRYMVISLIAVVFGLMLAYTLYQVQPQAGKTLNAVLFERTVGGWGSWGYAFILITLISEAAILFVAAQTGFLGGPRVLANMAADKWVPKRFSLLSDRLVTINGILIMGVGALVLMAVTNGSVGFMVILYSINVFITFSLTQLGMIRHWLNNREGVKGWWGKLIMVSVGLVLTLFILISVTIIKFFEGGWITIFITGTLAVMMSLIRINYDRTDAMIKELNELVDEVEARQPVPQIPVLTVPVDLNDPKTKTAVVLVKDFTGAGLKTLFNLFNSFGSEYRNFIFVQVGLIDATAFRGSEEMEKVRRKVEFELKRYVSLLQRHGYQAEAVPLYGIDTLEEVEKEAPRIMARFPKAHFFGGQIVFPRRAFLSNILHNYTLFTLQKRLHKMGITLFVLPIELGV